MAGWHDPARYLEPQSMRRGRTATTTLAYPVLGNKDNAEGLIHKTGQNTDEENVRFALGLCLCPCRKNWTSAETVALPVAAAKHLLRFKSV